MVYKECFKQVYPSIREPEESDAELFNQCVTNYVDTYRFVAKTMINHVWA
jgi:hypothetical protein